MSTPWRIGSEPGHDRAKGGVPERDRKQVVCSILKCQALRGTRGQARRDGRLAPPRRRSRTAARSNRGPDIKVGPGVRPFVVVVSDELPERPLKMALAADEQPVEARVPRCADKALGEHVRPGSPYRRPDDTSADGPFHVVERANQVGVTVTNEGTDSSALVFEGSREVPGLLSDPARCRVGRQAGQVDLPPLEVYENNT
jgi:hypothetical protein